MEFLYTIDPESERPKMCLFGEIGATTVDQGVVADIFCRELMFLDTQNKSCIDVWINSGGGSVTDGMQIFNTIIKTKTKVDTHNIGMAASIAGPIFLAGRNRFMMDNAVFMMHPVSGGDDKAREVFESSVNTMLASRSFLNTEKIAEMMAVTTWLDAESCEKIYGLCEVEYAGDKNRPRKRPEAAGPKELWKAYQNNIDTIIQTIKTPTMERVTNKLNLVKGSNEDAILNAIETLENKAKADKGMVDKMKADMDEMEDKFGKMKAEYDKVCKDLSDMENAKNKAELEKKEAKAKEVITNAVKIGKIKNEAATIDLWTKNYLSNPEGTEAMIDAIPLTKAGAKLPVSNSANADSDVKLTNAIGMYAAELRNKFNNK